MDGLGSTRLGRASSRYGSTTVFNGPVRKWKKKWVHVSSPSSANQNTHSQSNNGNGNGGTNLMLCRWTPLSPADSESAAPEEPPKRKFRYMPIAMLEEGGQRKTAVKQVEEEAKTSEINESINWLSSKNDLLNMNSALRKGNQDTNIGHLDLGLSLKGQVSGSKSSVQQSTSLVNSGGFWKMG